MKKIVKDINTKNPLWKLKKITIKANEESELTIKDAVSQYQKDFIQTTMKVMDNIIILKAFKISEKNYGHGYNTEVITEIIRKLQNKDNDKKKRKLTPLNINDIAPPNIN
eukprot:519586_1